ncbi:hypothetical protein QE152_g19557 [Popillia japonica]|uniref:Uncharacterized protein n=1 Tax=Popillia japonica TaxID=7064 RepID=A0AAW1KQ35_POPJA
MVGEITEMLKTSNLLHRSLITIDDNTKDVPNMRFATCVQFGNKVALLCGDYLLSNIYQQLASIKDQDLNDLISSAVRDLAESEFIGVRDKNNKPLPSKPTQENTEFEIPAEFGIRPSSFTHFLGNAKTEWILRSTLSGASLLGKACKGVLLLAGHDKDFQMKGFLLGKYLALSLEAARDYTSVFSDRKISPISAPMLFHLQRYPTSYSTIERVINNESNFDDSDIRRNAKTEWILRSTLSGASLLGKACKGVLLLAGHDEDFQMKGFLLGKYLALSLEAARDYTSVFSDRKISPISAPMLFHLQRYPTFYSTIERVINNESNFDDSDIRSKLQKSVALSDTISLQNEFSEKTLSILEHFRDAKIALRNIIHSIKLEV